MRTGLIFLLGVISNAADLLLIFLKIDHLFLVKDSFRWMMNQSRSCVVCRDIFLSTATVILPVV